jgi:DNA-binding protein H-NS
MSSHSSKELETGMIDLEGMSRGDLVKLRADVDKAIAGVADREKRAALKAAEQAAREHGFSLADLMEGGSARGAGRRGRGAAGATAASEAKFRNPNNAEQTWSGRGRRPRWVHEAEAAGRSLEDMRVR